MRFYRLDFGKESKPFLMVAGVKIPCTGGRFRNLRELSNLCLLIFKMNNGDWNDVHTYEPLSYRVDALMKLKL